MEQKRANIEEEKLKETVYTSFIQKRKAAAENLSSAQRELDEEKYEGVNAGHFAARRNKAGQEMAALDQQIVALTHRPYFTHIGVQWRGDDAPEHYLFSDSEQLDAEFKVSDGREPVTILPFKQYDDKPLYNKLRLLRGMPSGNDIEIAVDGELSVCTPQLVRDVEIEDRKLLRVIPLFPADAQSADPDETAINADELLAQRLEENRTDARLRNIIATLQEKQFEIINSDINSSFAVQGCAGSGKTQCLIHRLFFLRESLSESGWNKVLLITPTCLFRNYAAELMQRYRLSDIANLSLAEFYCKLLEAYDSRFRSRQYAFELSEEYLPDEYLQKVYDAPMIATIDNEIRHALWVHVDNGLSLLGETLDPNARIDIDLVNRVAERLAERIKQFDVTEKSLSELPEYAEHRAMIDTLETQQKTLLRRQSTLMEMKEKLAEDKKQFDLYQQAIEAAEREVESWKLSGETDLQMLADTLRECASALTFSRGTPAMAQPALKYAEALFNLCDAAEPWGKKNTYNREYLDLLKEIVAEARQRLLDFTKGLSAEAWLKDYDKRVKTNEESLQRVADNLAQNQQEQENHSQWLSAQNVENADKQRSSQRAALERARYYLTRIESAVFEQDVWNVLTPYKKASGIQTLIVEQLPDGHQKQTRILYKSDLLFYLKIYAALHRTSNLPDYSLICIDEGQDLHRADYDFLRRLYPRARFNIFGDTVQSLHEACGVSDWRRDAGVDTVYEMKSNYRNTPAIVDFCNSRFGEHMDYCGNIRSEQRPTLVRDRVLLEKVIRQPDQTVILKDRQAFEELLSRTAFSADDAVYIDTKADEVPAGKIPCYSIFAAKGLEFTRALVYAKNMSRNQKIVACTRAMEQLYYCE